MIDMDVDKLRKDFPILDKVVYLDSAATTQKPVQVIDALSDFYRDRNSNVARGIYKLAEEATYAYEEVRGKAKAFINARSEKEIIFTKNTTEGSNLVMRGWGEKFISKGDKIVTTIMEHHSNFVPWQQLAKRRGAVLEVAGITDEGLLDMRDLEGKMKSAKLVAVSAASNVLGTMPDAREICKLAHDNDALCYVDGAQYVPSNKTDVRKIDCDFLTFSGHKMLAPFSTGVLYGRQDILEEMDPFLFGSEMIRVVREDETEWNDLPLKFESGTPEVAGTICLGVAIDYLKRIGMDDIRGYEESLTSYMLKRLSEVDGLDVLGPQDAKKRTGLAAFTMKGAHPHDVAAMLNEYNICVRSGHHCAMPLHELLGIPASTRASIYLYNKEEEIDRLVEALEKIRKVFC